MKQFLNRTVRIGGIVMVAASLAACGPDDSQAGGLSHFSLADAGDWADGPFDGAPYEGGDLGLLPAALPMVVGGQPEYGFAPSWDYTRDQFVDYGDFDGYGPEDASYLYPQDSYLNASGGPDDYAWLGLATAIAATLGDSPPDFGFEHAGVQPWAWRTGDGYLRYAEPIRDGRRYYYYRPGATRPFLVRDPYYSYGYRDDGLAVVYDRRGRLLDQRAALRQRRAAHRYLERAQELYRAARAERRHGIAARQWEQRRAALAADRRALVHARAERAAWRQWDRAHQRDLRDRWQREQAVRKQAANRFEGWRQASYAGPAPRLYEAAQQRFADQQRAKREEAVGHARQADRREAGRRVAQQARQAHRVEAALRQERARAQRQAVAEQRKAAQRQAAAERKLKVQRQAVAERQAKAHRQAVADRRETAQRHAVADRRETAQRHAAAERKAKAQRHALAERQAKAQRQAVAERQVKAQREAAAERQAKAQRQASAKRQAAAERRAKAQRQAEMQRQAKAQRTAAAQRAARDARAEAHEREAAAEKARAAEARQAAREEKARAQRERESKAAAARAKVARAERSAGQPGRSAEGRMNGREPR